MRRFKPIKLNEKSNERRTLALKKPLTNPVGPTAASNATASATTASAATAAEPSKALAIKTNGSHPSVSTKENGDNLDNTKSIKPPNQPLETLAQYDEYFNQQGAKTVEKRMLICHIRIAEDKKSSMEMARYMIAVAKSITDLEKAYNILKEESALGNHFATLELAKLYRNGKENLVKQDNKIALDNYRLAIQQGSYLAAMTLGISYENSMMGLDRNLELAYKNYEEANKLVKEGDGKIADVYFRLARCLYYSIGCPQDIKRAIVLLRNTANFEHGEAHCLLGEILEKYSLVREFLKNEGDLQESLYWYEKAADNRVLQALIKLGTHYKDLPGFAAKAKSFQYFLKVSETGRNLECDKQVIYCYLEGIGTGVNIEKARSLLNFWVAGDDEQIQFYHVVCEINEGYQKKQYEKAWEYIEKLNKFKTKNDLARNHLHKIYKFGFGHKLEKNEYYALNFLSKELKDTAYLQTIKGSFFEQGLNGYECNSKKAFELYHSAFSNGYICAGSSLAIGYLMGFNGERNLLEAIKIAKMLEKAGFEKSAKVIYDLCYLISGNENQDAKRKVDFNELHTHVLNGEQNIAYILCKYYLSTNPARAIEYFQYCSKFSDIKSHPLFIEASRPNAESAASPLVTVAGFAIEQQGKPSVAEIPIDTIKVKKDVGKNIKLNDKTERPVSATNDNKMAECEKLIKRFIEAKSKKEVENAIKMLDGASKRGNELASYELGTIYLEGKPNLLARNNKLSLQYYRIAIEQGNCVAAFTLARYYNSEVLDLKFDAKTIYELFEKANSLVTEHDNDTIVANIYFNLAMCLHSPMGCEKDVKRAITLFAKSAKLNLEAAQLKLNEIIENYPLKKGTLEKNSHYSENLEIHKAAAANGHWPSYVMLGNYYKDIPGFEEKAKSFQYFLLASKESTNLYVDKHLIHCYLEGVGTVQNVMKAKSFLENWPPEQDEQIQFLYFICNMIEDFRRNSFERLNEYIEKLKALKEKNPLARQYLFRIYAGGFGNGVQNLPMAASFFSDELNDVPALQFEKGRFYEQGLGGYSKDIAKAFKQYEAAFSNGEALAGHRLACCYIIGKAVNPDLKKAIEIARILEQAGFDDPANLIYDLCSLLDQNKAPQRKVNFNKLHQLATSHDAWNYDIAYVLSQFYLKIDFAKSTDYIRHYLRLSGCSSPTWFSNVLGSQIIEKNKQKEILEKALAEERKKETDSTESHSAAIADLQSKLEKMNDEWLASKEENSRVKQQAVVDRQTLQENVAKIKINLSNQIANFNAVKKKMAELKSQIVKNNEKIVGMKTSLTLAQKRLTDEIAEHEALKEVLTKASSDRGQLQLLLETLEKSQKSDSEMTKELERSCENITSEKNGTNVLVKSLETDITGMQRDLNRMQAADAAVIKNTNDLQTSLTSQKALNKISEETLQKLKIKLGSLEEESQAIKVAGQANAEKLDWIAHMKKGSELKQFLDYKKNRIKGLQGTVDTHKKDAIEIAERHSQLSMHKSKVIEKAACARKDAEKEAESLEELNKQKLALKNLERSLEAEISQYKSQLNPANILVATNAAPSQNLDSSQSLLFSETLQTATWNPGVIMQQSKASTPAIIVKNH